MPQAEYVLSDPLRIAAAHLIASLDVFSLGKVIVLRGLGIRPKEEKLRNLNPTFTPR